MNPAMTFMMLFSLIMGTLITISSSHWLMAWMGLEISTFAIIPLMTQNHHPRATEATIKYFIVQTAAATLLLFVTTSNAWLTGQWEIQQINHPLLLSTITIALALKMGLAPLHAWFPEVLQGLNLSTGLILSTWQKLAPFSLMYQISTSNTTLLIIFGLTSILMGGWGGLNQTQLRKILAYSSVAHLGWMMLVLQYKPQLAFLAFIMYVILTAPMFLTFIFIQSATINSLSISSTKIPIISATAPLMLLSLGGLPPLTGFLPKWAILTELTKQNMMTVATMAALSALLSLYFYLRLSYAMTLTSSPNNTPAMLPWRTNNTQNTLLLAISIPLSLLMLPISPSMLAFLFH
uniref:NADH-ubiquinone oxidoreductase chain 2 n=1 Tax=Laimosemion tecminae TaxID=105036 RepID=A0A3G1TWR1_9TELE|nr:NADH dehydrogenase subunit 2 [Laimosemion tecminae]AYG54894.1 NADH dehydrogenase subunit 2 [Laimosemion tecminae]AYG54895.1 NADH dehydrogenase subunit 2 [Laimosemion tecminae]AYG54896.1 NADH dehydrogenase subunit 2 [Laimosemion tecminae]AYG54897.1 NADH dehydrogenase subunit 2 [Laimosemion tecminae]